MNAIELNFGAIILKRDDYDDATENTLVNALWALEERDTYFFSEPWQLGGLEVYPLYNCPLDVCYSLTSGDLDKLDSGEAVALEPHAPETWEREELAREEVNA